jgi:hypothetical protein
MAKRGRRAGMTVAQIAENKLVDFAEDLGRTLGSARSKAEGWLAQRSQIAKTLEEIRQTASSLLTQLTGGKPASAARRRGRGKTVKTAAPRRRLSAAARERIAAAQRKRWAAVRRKKAAAGA